MPPCKFWQQGNCRNGDNCRFEHIGNPGDRSDRSDKNRFGPLREDRGYVSDSPRSHNDNRNYGSNSRHYNNDRHYDDRDYGSSNSRNYHNDRNYNNRSPRPGTNSNQSTERIPDIDRDMIRKELSNELPIWIMSCYSPLATLPKQLFGGPEREISPEEVRLLHYERVAQGVTHEAAQVLATEVYNNAKAQIDNVLKDLPGAIQYLKSGYSTHPNRNDICKDANETGKSVPVDKPAAQPAVNNTAFGQPSISTSLTSVQASTGSAFGQPSMTSTFGRPSGNSTFGQPSVANAFSKPVIGAFGQPSSLGTQSGFGQPSSLGTQSAFGQPSSLGAQSAFGAPSALGTQSGFGAPSALGAKPSPFAATSQSSNPFMQAAASNNSAFGKPSIASDSANQNSNPFSQQNGGSSGFGQPSGFGRTNSVTMNGTSESQSGFGQVQRNGPQNSTPSRPGTQIRDWNGRPVRYFENYPCYQLGDGFWQRIWFPDGPPKQNKPEPLPTDLPYDTTVEESYKYAKENGGFANGMIPLVPPKGEWIEWNF